MHGVKLATWDFCCNSFRICFIVSGSLFGSLPVHCPVLSGFTMSVDRRSFQKTWIHR